MDLADRPLCDFERPGRWDSLFSQEILYIIKLCDHFPGKISTQVSVYIKIVHINDN
jgi:hypothetical protein